MPKLANWVNVMNMKNEVMNRSVEDLDIEIIKIMKNLGAKEI
jgi:hypothetical protein